jgi:hypothetical protein
MGPGNILMAVGAVAFVVGAALRFAPWLLNWLGRLPGDIALGEGSVRVFFPLTTLLVINVLLYGLFRLLGIFGLLNRQ